VRDNELKVEALAPLLARAPAVAQPAAGGEASARGVGDHEIRMPPDRSLDARISPTLKFHFGGSIPGRSSVRSLGPQTQITRCDMSTVELVFDLARTVRAFR